MTVAPQKKLLTEEYSKITGAGYTDDARMQTPQAPQVDLCTEFMDTLDSWGSFFILARGYEYDINNSISS